MTDRFAVEKIQSRKGDFPLFVLLALLAGLGLAALFSASYFFGSQMEEPNPFVLVEKQLIFLGLGIVGAFIISRLPLESLRPYALILFFSSILLLLAPWLPIIGNEIKGARRWIYIGPLSIQPSELVKVSMVFYMAHILDKKRDRIDDYVAALVPPIFLCGSAITIVVLQKDFSTAAFLTVMLLVLLLIGGVNLKFYFSMGGVALLLLVLMMLIREYRVDRLLAFLDPNIDPQGSGYQILAAKSALTRGGWMGAGFGQGVQKIGGLPEAHSDFIFAVLGEEVGFLGVLFVIILFIAFAFRGLQISFSCKKDFYFFLAFGFTMTILLQAVMHFMIVAGLVPATGIPLPFFSAGGSSLFVTMIMAGIIMNVSRNVSVESDGAAYE